MVLPFKGSVWILTVYITKKRLEVESNEKVTTVNHPKVPGKKRGFLTKYKYVLQIEWVYYKVLLHGAFQ